MSSFFGNSKAIDRQVDHFVFETRFKLGTRPGRKELDRLGDQIVPRLIELLKDPSLRKRLVEIDQPEDGNAGPTFIEESPFIRLCLLLQSAVESIPKNVVLLLDPFLRAEQEFVRCLAGRIVGSFPYLETLPLIRFALFELDESVRDWTLRAISDACKAGRVDINDELVPMMMQLWEGKNALPGSGSMPDLLLQLDRERAIEFLTNDELISRDFVEIVRLLRVLNQASVKVSRVRLHQLIAEASLHLEEKSKRSRSLISEALLALALHHEVHDQPLLERFAGHESASVSHGATLALWEFHQFSKTLRDPEKVLGQKGWESLTEAEKIVFAIDTLEMQIINGGIGQYFVNVPPNMWSVALNGLRAIGANRRHDVFLSAINKETSPREAAVNSANADDVYAATFGRYNEETRAWSAITDECLPLLLLRYNMANLEGRLI